MKIYKHLSDFKDFEGVEKYTTIFLHIPKSAGQTLFQILNREYKRSNIYTFQGGRQRLAASIDEFGKLSVVQRNKYLLLRGHVKFGIHHMITQPFTYITILRDPISRVLSHYQYVCRTPAHALHETVASSGMGIEQYISRGLSTELNNGQVRLISGVGSDLPFGQCEEWLLSKAINNLEAHFSVVGLTERFNETILLMSQQLKWKNTPYYVKKNVTKNKTFDLGLRAETIEVIREYNKLDLALYEYVAAQFEQVVAQKLPIGVQERFECINGIYRPYGQAMSLVSSWLKSLQRR